MNKNKAALAGWTALLVLTVMVCLFKAYSYLEVQHDTKLATQCELMGNSTGQRWYECPTQ